MIRALSSVRRLHFIPSLISTSACIAIVVGLILCIKAKTHGMFVYPLDDSYIHLSLARTLANHHVWGMNPTEFASASSSPGWTVLLAAANVLFGTRLMTPIVLNLMIAACLLGVADTLIRRQAPGVTMRFRILAGLAIVVATPLPSLVLLGMEHVAQTLLVLLVIWYGARIACLDPAQKVPPRDLMVLCLSAASAGAIRYEAVFTVTLIGILLLLRKRIIATLVLALCSALGPAAFGFYFHRHSGFWLPFSVISKSVMFHPLLSDSIWFLLGRSSAPVILFCLLVWLYRRSTRSLWDVTQLILLLTVGVGTLHSLFAPVGWLMRYESYFVCVGITALLLVLAQRSGMSPPRYSQSFGLRSFSQRVTGVIAFLVFILLLIKLGHRVELGFVFPVQAAVDRYDEHIQMARFVESSYSQDTIVLNDIGAVEYYSGAKLLDVLGLGSEESLKDIYRTKTFLPSHLNRWAEAENASIAIIQIDYSYIRRPIPQTWPLAQVWHIPRNIIFSDHSIAFFAVHPSDVNRLCDALKRFDLPQGDVVSYDACPQLTDPNPAARLAIPADIASKLAQSPF